MHAQSLPVCLNCDPAPLFSLSEVQKVCVVYTFAWQASLTHFQLQTQIPFGVMPGRASTVKVCQIKHAELPTVVPHCEKGAAESSFRSQQSTERHVTCMGQAVMFFSALCGSTFQVLSAKCSPSDDDGG